VNTVISLGYQVRNPAHSATTIRDLAQDWFWAYASEDG
jgi:hypothetical protein